jgi:hypothetical protein
MHSKAFLKHMVVHVARFSIPSSRRFESQRNKAGAILGRGYSRGASASLSVDKS